MKLNSQESFFVVFSDETSEDRDERTMTHILRDMAEVADVYGYSIQSFGTYDQAIKFFQNQKTLDEIRKELNGE